MNVTNEDLAWRGTEAYAGAALAAKPTIEEINGAQVLVNPDGSARVLEELMLKPVRQSGWTILRDIDSFKRFTAAKAKEGSEVHVKAEGEVSARLIINADGWADFGAVYQPVFTQSFKDWTEKDGEKFGQEDFAAFIEKHIDDIHGGDGMPTSADLLSFCSAIEDKRQVSFKRSVSTQDGRVNLVYEDKVSDAQEKKLSLFREFKVALRPRMDSATSYAITAALRFRIRDGEITFWYELKGIEELLEQDRKTIKTELETTGVPVYLADI